MSATHHWRFDPLDTWFFREARGFEMSGGTELSSLFPPPARTVAGAIRTLIGEQRDVDWARFPDHADYAELRRLIGDGDSLGQLALTGPYPLWEGERLYPVPLHLLAKDNESCFLTPGDAVRCDLGDAVRLPQLKAPLMGAKPLENAWLTAENLQRVLKGEKPQAVIKASHLYAKEHRLGIARDNKKRTGQDGLLYQTRHLRPRPELAIGAETCGLPADLYPKSGVMRFGGEGRPTAVQVSPTAPAPLPVPKIVGRNLLLMLLTPADFGGTWELPTWPEIPVKLECAVLGKTMREGGWDLARQRPRPVRSLVPAGSIYFCTLETDDVAAAVAKLHGQHIGLDTALGRGELAVGIW
jgi:CRISPR-associated protein Cmr3